MKHKYKKNITMTLYRNFQNLVSLPRKEKENVHIAYIHIYWVKLKIAYIFIL